MGVESGSSTPFWSAPLESLLRELRTTPRGLDHGDASARLARLGPGLLRPTSRTGTTRLLARQFGSPLMLLLIAAALLSLGVGQTTDALTILVVVFASGLLGFWQERRASDAVSRLIALVRVTTTVLRGGAAEEIPREDVVPGDVVTLSAGAAVPADCRVLDAQELFVDEAALTGESFPVQKRPGVCAADAPVRERDGVLFLGTHVVTGRGTAVVVLRGSETTFGDVVRHLGARPPQTEFERSLRRFGYLLLQVTLVLSLSVFAINVALHRPVLESLLFTLALAVGLAPELLPAIVSVALAHGARSMARQRVIVKRLAAIEDLGSMSVLCLDKTGTITEGVVRLRTVRDALGAPSEQALRCAYINAATESGYASPIDEALRSGQRFELAALRKLDEVPFDFARKRLSVLIDEEGTRRLITKGALLSILDVCTTSERADGTRVPIADDLAAIEKAYALASADGLRCLGVSSRLVPESSTASRDDERDMTFLGILTFADPPKAGANEDLAALARLGVRMKLLTGDNRLVAASVARVVGLPVEHIVTGRQLRELSDGALRARVLDTDIFAEVEPNDKARVIRALRERGEVVGFLGDGINDSTGLHSADVGISVDSAVDATKEAADIVLLDKDLGVLAAGLREGRRAFANTLKYMFITTSANFGNMLSMAVASIFTPFLPLLPKQILLVNLLTDLPSVAVAADQLDPELVALPRRWDNQLMRRFMITFGLVSSVFDLLTFGFLLWYLRSDVAQFRTGWFEESVLSEILVLLVIRTQRPFFRSRIGTALMVASVAVAGVTVALPYLELGAAFGLAPLRAEVLLAVGAIVTAYVLASELTKRAFFRIRPPTMQDPGVAPVGH